VTAADKKPFYATKYVSNITRWIKGDS